MRIESRWLRQIVVGSLASFGLAGAGHASPPLPYLHEVFGRAVVSKDNQGIFTYAYNVTNGQGSVGDLTWFWIIVAQPSDGVALPFAGLVDAPRNVTGRRAAEQPDAVPMVPVAFPSFPSGWLAGSTGWGAAHWAVDDDADLLRPGTSAGGFLLTSWGIPTIRPFHAYPDFDARLLEFYPDVDTVSDEEAERIRVQLEQDRAAIEFKGQTVGPTAPPKVFDPVKYTAYILDLKNQSRALGWIKDEAASAELGSRLSAISNSLSSIVDQKIPVTTGRVVLELAAQFMQYVESNSCKEFECAVPEGQSPKPLTSEAYALMYFNMDYFATQVAKACNLPAPQVSPSPRRKSKAAGKK